MVVPGMGALAISMVTELACTQGPNRAVSNVSDEQRRVERGQTGERVAVGRRDGPPRSHAAWRLAATTERVAWQVRLAADTRHSRT